MVCNQQHHLALVMLGVLAIPHSSSHCERVFSTVRKNRTDQRASLSDDTLEAMLVLKSQPGHATDDARQHSTARLEVLRGDKHDSVSLSLSTEVTSRFITCMVSERG